MEAKNKYAFCLQNNCDKFKSQQEAALKTNESIFDAAVDLQRFVDVCCKNCSDMPDNLKK